jgi:SAM-dependent methyltransferase
MNATAAKHYSSVTEQPGQAASHSQLAMMAARYAWARSYAVGRDVLEVGCGSGTGLGVLAEVARTVEAGDVDESNVETARGTYALTPNVRVQQLDALDLPYGDACFDVVVLFEAIYYLPDAQRFIESARRVLRPGGHLLVSTVNREWSGFNPSPFHTLYFPASGLREMLESAGFSVQVFAGFPEQQGGMAAVIGVIRRAAVRLHLVPRTMAGKTFFKRLFYGTLEPIPARLDLRSQPAELPRILPERADPAAYRVLYAAASKNS